MGVDSPDLSVGRVRSRTEEAGHDVLEEKIRARYERGHPQEPGARLRGVTH